MRSCRSQHFNPRFRRNTDNPDAVNLTMPTYYVCEINHPTAIDKTGLANAIDLGHKMIVIAEGSKNNWKVDGKNICITNCNKIGANCFDITGRSSPKYIMNWDRNRAWDNDRTWKKHCSDAGKPSDERLGNTEAHKATFEGVIHSFEASNLTAARNFVKGKIEAKLPKQYIAETGHLSDCHMVVKVTKAAFGKGPWPPPLRITDAPLVATVAGFVGGLF